MRKTYVIYLFIIIFDKLAYRYNFQIVTNNNKTMDKYSILLPTYNEKENLPIMIWLITKYMDER